MKKIGQLAVSSLASVVAVLPAHAHVGSPSHIHAEQSIFLLFAVSCLLLTGFLVLFYGKK